MTKFKVVVTKLVTAYCPMEAIYVSGDDHLERITNYKNIQPYLNRGFGAFFIQYAHILTVNNQEVPKEWVIREQGHADVLIVRGNLNKNDFEVVVWDV